MFLDFYKLREQPFGETPDPRYIYLSPTHREAIASLAYGIKMGRGFLALVSEPGMGKTTVLFHLLECLRESASTAFLFQTQCNSRDLLCYLLADLGIDTHGRELPWIHEQLNKLLIREASIGRKVVVFIDEAHNLSESALETVRLLSDFENPRSKLIQIVIAGQLELGDKLERPELAQLRQRVSSLTRLSPLTRFETEAYISHRLSKAGFQGAPLFTPEASAKIAEWSRGVPRAINNLCFNALSLGYAMGKAVVDSSVVLEAARDLDPQRVSVGLVSPAVAPASELSVASAAQEFSSANYVAPPRKGFEAVAISADLGRKEQESPNAGVLPLPEPANDSPKLTGRLVEGSTTGLANIPVNMPRVPRGVMVFAGAVLAILIVIDAAGLLFLNHVRAQPVVTKVVPSPLNAKGQPGKTALKSGADLKASQLRFKANPASATKALHNKFLSSNTAVYRSGSNR